MSKRSLIVEDSSSNVNNVEDNKKRKSEVQSATEGDKTLCVTSNTFSSNSQKHVMCLSSAIDYGWQALIFSLSKNYIGAIENYQKALDLLPENDTDRVAYIKNLATMHQAQGNCLYDSNDYHEASKHFREEVKLYSLLESTSNDPLELATNQEVLRANHFFILALLEANKKYNDLLPVLDEIGNACTEISKLSSNYLFYVYVHNRIGNALLEYDKEVAKTHYLKCLELINSFMTIEGVDLKPIDELLMIIEKYIEREIIIDPSPKYHLAVKHIKYMNMMKIAEIQLNNLKIAKNSKRTVDLSSHYHSLGKTFYSISLKDKTNASKFLERSVECFQKSGTIFSLLKIVKIDPNNLDANLTLSKLYESRNETEKSIEHLNIAENLYPKLYQELDKAMKLNVTEIRELTGNSATINNLEHTIQQSIAENKLKVKSSYDSITSSIIMPSSIVDIVFTYYTGDEEWVERMHDGQKLLGSSNNDL